MAGFEQAVLCDKHTQLFVNIKSLIFFRLRLILRLRVCDMI